MNVYQKLNAAREEFHALKLEKTGHNKFAGYKYFELGDFLIPALKVFAKHGLCGTVNFEEREAMLTVRNVDKPDEFIVIGSPMGSAALKGCHDVQNIGAVETYQRRYLWVAALEIVEHDAVDSSEPQEVTSPALTSYGKKVDRTLVMKVRRAISEHIAHDRDIGALQEWEEACAISEDFAADVWAGLTTPERDKIRALRGNKVKYPEQS